MYKSTNPTSAADTSPYCHNHGASASPSSLLQRCSSSLVDANRIGSVRTCWRWVDTLFFNQSTIQSTIHLISLKKIIYIYIQETDNKAFFIKAYHSLCLGLESLPCLPGLLLCCRLLVAVNQNPDEPQLQDDDQHVHHYLGNHRRQLRCRCGGHSR